MLIEENLAASSLGGVPLLTGAGVDHGATTAGVDLAVVVPADGFAAAEQTDVAEQAADWEWLHLQQTETTASAPGSSRSTLAAMTSVLDTGSVQQNDPGPCAAGMATVWGGGSTTLQTQAVGNGSTSAVAPTPTGALGVTLLTISGSVTDSTTSGGTTASVGSVSLGLSLDGVDVSVNLPVDVPVVAAAAGGDWSNLATWDGGYQALATITDATYIGSAFQGDVGALIDVTGATLNGQGPSNNANLSIPIATTDYFLIPINFSLAFNIAFEITIPDLAQIVMDQANVEVNSITLGLGGSLTSIQSLTIDTSLTNSGIFQVNSGSKVTVEQEVINYGTLIDTGDLAFPSMVENYDQGLIEIGSGTTLTGTVTNYGKIDAVSGGIIVLDLSTIRYGTIEADSGGTVEFDYRAGAVLRDTVLTGTGNFESADGSNSYDGYYYAGSELQDITIEAGTAFTVVELASVALGGTITNSGKLAGADGYNGSYFTNAGGSFIVDGPVTLMGGGQIQLGLYSQILGGQNQSAPLLHLNDGPDALDNIDNTISGAGIITVALTNETAGVIDADTSGQTLTLDSSITNKGLIEATAGTLMVYGTYTIENAGGCIKAGSGGTVSLDYEFATIWNGIVEADNGGTVVLDDRNGGGVLRDTILTGVGTFQSLDGSQSYNGHYYQGAELQDVSLNTGVAFTVVETALVALGGTIINEGALIGADGYNGGYFINLGGSFIVDGPVTITGGGELSLGLYSELLGGQTNSNYSAVLLHLNPGPDALDNLDNTISGDGAIYVALTNEADGVIDANVSGQTLTLDSSITNKGLIEATAGGLQIYGCTVDNTGGLVEATSGGTVLVDYGTLRYGTVEADSGGTVGFDYRGAGILRDTILTGVGTFQSLDGSQSYNGYYYQGSELQDVSLDTGVIFIVARSSYIALGGVVANSGTLQGADGFNNGYSGASGGSLIIDGPVTLMGGGQIQLGLYSQILGGQNQSAPLLHLNDGPDALDNIDNTISGAGIITVALTNETAGVIDADTSGQTLTLDSSITNKGLIEATAGTLMVYGTTVDNTVGRIEAAGGLVLLDYSTVNGGALQANSGGVVQVDATGELLDVLLTGGGEFTVISGGAATNVTLSGATLELTSGAVTGGTLGFSGNGSSLKIDGPVMPAATITGFVPGDTIDLVNTPFSSTGVVSVQFGNVLQIDENDSTFNLNLDPNQNFAGYTFHIATDGGTGTLITELIGQTTPRDFNADGTSDILWQSPSGNIAIWDMSAATLAASSVVGFADPTAWTIRGTGDFNADGTADILWGSTSGNVAVWEINAGTMASSSVIGFADPASWSIKATGDFNGDGTSDILWQSTSGSVAVWDMNAGTVAGSGVVGFADPSSWHIAGAGDFAGVGTSDILWQDNSGNVAIWAMNGGTVSQTSIVGFADPSAWHIAGEGDFDGNGTSDILWGSTAGNVAIWEMNGLSVAQQAVVGFADPSTWRIAGIGDYNGDGKADILWRDTSGDAAVWQMNGTTIANSSLVGFADPATWSIVPPDNTGDIAAGASSASGPSALPLASPAHPQPFGTA